MTDSQGRVLIIAGSDSSGGAGIQADIKTCAAFGAYTMTAITAVTAQNTVGVQAVEMMPATLVKQQIESCLSDIGADVVKIGMLGTKEIIEVVAEAVDELDAFVILDPVAVATSGDALLDEDALVVLRDKLLPLADLVTPNVPEAELLTGLNIEDVDDLTKAGDVLLEKGVYAALMKGGHLSGKSVVDVLVSEEGANIMSGPRLHTRHTHGTGCTLASAVAANMALGLDLDEAVMRAREFVFEAIRSAPGFGSTKGHGPLNHGLALMEEEEAETPAGKNPFAALKGLTT
ncbi:bifunctional hydroxymethylpyrimidine kinase/phosphomethylpyrimidine kinase [Litorimonas sp. WD9-15]|uniref:bifunctional hydroxymethylpyrimidine kinase/phosphomethylpyrimidine kinase n=1 Tax=Litorimonas sp. WD9-15 TaxID=3418716 RepID=UPI003D0127DF